MLETVDLKKKLNEKQYKKELLPLQARLRELEFKLYRKQVPLLCLFEGWDAAGKGGAIQRLTESLDPRGFTVSSFSAPQGDDKTHHYLWRFWKAMPRAGHIGIFDRSYYGRVLVERVERFCSENEWKRAYREINEFEAHQASARMVICKFWLHISLDEQLRRFKSRERDQFRSYKLTPEDWRNRARTDEYRQAVEDMIERTSTSTSPWTVVPANDKLYARVHVLRTVAGAVEEALASLKH